MTYYDTAKLTVVKSCIIQGPGSKPIKTFGIIYANISELIFAIIFALI